MKHDYLGIVLTVTLAVLAGLAAVTCDSGCSPNTPTTQPVVTGPNGNTAEDQLYQVFAGKDGAPGTVAMAETAAAIAISAGVVPPQDVLLINAAEPKVDDLLAKWGAVLDTPTADQAKTLFLAALKDFLPLTQKAQALQAAKVGVKLRH